MKKKIRKEIIIEKLREIEESVDKVEENLPSSAKNFLHLGLVKDGIYKKVEFAIENVIDICNILNTDLSLGVPSDEDSIIRNLEINKVLGKRIIEKIRKMKSFRNVLVHKYGKIDDERAFESMRDNLPDFEIFKKGILDFTNKNI